MAPMLIGIALLQAALLAGIVCMCLVRARSEKTGIILQLEKWQSSIAVILGFSGVIWTMQIDAYKEMRASSEKALTWYRAESQLAVVYGMKARRIGFWAKFALESQRKKDVKNCLFAERELHAMRISTLELSGLPEVDTSIIPSESLAAVLGIHGQLDEINHQLVRLDPDKDCSDGGETALINIWTSSESIERDIDTLVGFKRDSKGSKKVTIPPKVGR